MVKGAWLGDLGFGRARFGIQGFWSFERNVLEGCFGCVRAFGGLRCGFVCCTSYPVVVFCWFRDQECWGFTGVVEPPFLASLFHTLTPSFPGRLGKPRSLTEP